MATSEGKFFVFRGKAIKRFGIIVGLVIVAAALGLAVAPRPAGLVTRPQTPTNNSEITVPAVAGDQTVAPTAAPSAQSSDQKSTPRPVTGDSSRTNTSNQTAVVTVTPQPIVNLQLKSPAGSSQYAVKLIAITDACTILTAARDQGYVKSVTIDNSYLSTLKSAYVREINGYYNNWTFKVNGASPKGCSLASITTGDTVVWEYQ